MAMRGKGRAQSSIETMMTFGWALLILLIVGGILYYYGLFSPGHLAEKEKVGFGRMEVIDWTLDSQTDEVGLLLENRVGTDINVTSISVDGTLSMLNPAVTIAAGGRLSSFVNASVGKDMASQSFHKFDIVIRYERVDSPSLTLTSAGRLTSVAA